MTAPARPFVNSGGRPWLTRAARRDIRRAHAVASELKMHSFAVHGVVWTLKHDSMQGSSKKNNPNEPDSQKNESKPSRREQRASRSTQRAAAHHALMSRAQDHYARVLIRRWARSSADATEAAATDVAMTLESSPGLRSPVLRFMRVDAQSERLLSPPAVGRNVHDLKTCVQHHVCVRRSYKAAK